MNPFILLTADETRTVDRKAIESGIAGAQLMERAGTALFNLIVRSLSAATKADTDASDVKRAKIVIACGPGNNGGDGFVAARLLHADGWQVSVALNGARDQLNGDARLMADLYEGPLVALDPKAFTSADVIIDALFGSGLNRPFNHPYTDVIEAINTANKPVISVDIPSGVNADTGAVMGSAVHANITVTFVTRNPGHVLFPGRGLCGSVEIADIGIPDKILRALTPDSAINDIALWGRVWPQPMPTDHKYARGAAAIISGGLEQSGAARLAARGALRAGAGVVTILSPGSALLAHANHLNAIMVRKADSAEDIAAFLSDPRLTSLVVGPGLVSTPIDAQSLDKARGKVLSCIKSKARCILDADALTLFERDPQTLFSHLRADDIITPHSGEFARLFPDLATSQTSGQAAEQSKLNIAREAANRCGAIVVLKGADTIIASPAGQSAPARLSVNVNAPADLATAGSGDVLAGFIAGLCATRLPDGTPMPAFEAACGGVWLHGACGQYAGRGLIAEDLPDALPAIFKRILSPEPSA